MADDAPAPTKREFLQALMQQTLDAKSVEDCKTVIGALLILLAEEAA